MERKRNDAKSKAEAKKELLANKLKENLQRRKNQQKKTNTTLEQKPSPQ
jgi:hypothetical protein